VSALAERTRSGRLFGDRELRDAGRRELARHRESRSGGSGLTLEQLLDDVWEGLHADGAAECPVCDSRMTAAPGGGTCGGCGSTLA
jgi:hypothetical protein